MFNSRALKHLKNENTNYSGLVGIDSTMCLPEYLTW